MKLEGRLLDQFDPLQEHRYPIEATAACASAV
jgi:hypothetical protein